MNTNTEAVIAVARGFLGVAESPAGSNSVIFNTHYYGKSVSGAAYPWCAAFVWDVFRMAGLSPIYYGGGKTAACADVLAYAKKTGRLVAGGYRRGDVVLYRFGRTGAAADHIGIVTSADGASLRAVEGNTSPTSDSNGGEVLERARSLANVVGAYRPDYGADSADGALSLAEFELLLQKHMSIAGSGDAHSAWAETAIRAAVSSGLVSGGGNGDFGWRKPVTKETVAQMLYNLTQILRKG
ncbi:MAG: CHAP domain-containing protein [Oscillospiraceae bacterium]|jgi:hypothetical protein|nr:CHAP domain-containing protein [Oscillospiraceae bacterium]